MSREQITYLYAPKGEWYTSWNQVFSNAGLPLTAELRNYELLFEDSDLPIRFSLTRPKDVLKEIDDPDKTANAGYTGSDIYAEQRLYGLTPATPTFDQAELPKTTDQTSVFPLAELTDDYPQPKLYLGSTPWLREKNEQPKLNDIRDGSVYTSYPNITGRYFYRRGFNAIPVKIKPRAGAIEGKWRTDPTNMAIMDIESKGDTRKANEIEVMEILMQAQLLLVIGEAISQQDLLRVNYLQELLYLAAQRRRP